ELLTRPGDHITQRALINHRPKRAVSIVRLILSRGRNLNERSRPGTPDRVPSLILKHPPAPTPMIRTPVRRAASRPPRKQDGPHSHRTHSRRNQRRLAPLLRPHKLRPPKHKRITLLPQPSIITHRVIPRHELQLLRHQEKELALLVAIRDNAMGLHPLRHHIKRLPHPSPAPIDAHAPTSAASA